MIRTVIIEEQKLISEAFAGLLQNADGQTEILGSFSTVRDSINYFSQHEPPDLIFCDVELRDGLSFDIFDTVKVNSPVVFVTDQDRFLADAFGHNAIEYLLKPLDQHDVAKAICRYQSLEKHFASHQVTNFKTSSRKRTRLIVRKGIEHICLRMDEIAYLFTEDKIVYVVDQQGRKYFGDNTLSEMEQMLDSGMFYRANRQYIINVNFIRSYKAYEKVKLLVDMSVAGGIKPVIISQEMAASFRAWIGRL